MESPPAEPLPCWSNEETLVGPRRLIRFHNSKLALILAATATCLFGVECIAMSVTAAEVLKGGVSLTEANDTLVTQPLPVTFSAAFAGLLSISHIVLLKVMLCQQLAMSCKAAAVPYFIGWSGFLIFFLVAADWFNVASMNLKIGQKFHYSLYTVLIMVFIIAEAAILYDLSLEWTELASRETAALNANPVQAPAKPYNGGLRRAANVRPARTARSLGFRPPRGLRR